MVCHYVLKISHQLKSYILINQIVYLLFIFIRLGYLLYIFAPLNLLYIFLFFLFFPILLSFSNYIIRLPFSSHCNYRCYNYCLY
jgi:hypothetical protein